MKLTKSKLKQIIKEELSLLLKEKIEIGDTVKHEELGQGVVRAIRPKSESVGGHRVAVVTWDEKGENRQPIVGNLTVVKKGKKRTYGNN